MSAPPTSNDDALFEELRAVARELTSLGPNAIPGYELGGEIHRGGQGVVVRARQLSTRRVVAIKVLHADGSSYRDRLRFEREVDLACRLHHPGIVTVYDRGVTAGRPWYAMELVEGCTLDEHLARHRLELGQRLAVFHAICEAVAHAHRHGVIHRDLKPRNVLVDATGAPRVLDFGVGRALDEDHSPRITRAGEFAGTLTYASPEQVAGDPGAVDTRTDIYSLGVVLYEMVTGGLPYDISGSTAEVVGRITHADPRPPAVDRDLATILDHALAKDPRERYATVEDLARDVAHFLADEPLEARARSAWYELRKGLARHRTAIVAGAVLLVVTVVGGIFLAREHSRAERQRETAALVQDIFQDLLGAAAPQRMGGDVRLLEMFEEASERIEHDLIAAPDAQAAVQLTIGDTYRRLLMLSEAEPHLRRAVERYRRVDGRDRLELANALYVLGLVLAGQNRREAIDVEEEALALRRDALEPGDPRIAESERGLATALFIQWDASPQEEARAESLLLSALDRLRAALGDDHPEVAETMLRLAELRRESGGPDVEALMTRALSVFEETAPQDPRTIECLNAYSSFLQSQQRFEQAGRILARSVAATEELYGDERAVEMLRRQARLSYARGDLSTAEDLSRRAVARALERWALRRPECAASLDALAELMVDDTLAAPPYSLAFAALRALEGDGAFELASWANGIALVLAGLDRADETEPILREALNIRCRAFGRDCPIRRRTIQQLSEYLVAEGRQDEAIPLLEESLEAARRLDELGSPRAQRAEELLAICRQESR